MNWVNKEKSYLSGWIDGVEDAYEELENNKKTKVEDIADEIRGLGGRYTQGYFAGRNALLNAKSCSESKERIEYLIGI